MFPGIYIYRGWWFKESYGKHKSNTNPLLLLVSVAGVEGSTGSRSARLGEAGKEAESPGLPLCIPGREPGHSCRRRKAATNRCTALSWKQLVLFCGNLACSCYGNGIRRMQRGRSFFFLCAESPTPPWKAREIVSSWSGWVSSVVQREASQSS